MSTVLHSYAYGDKSADVKRVGNFYNVTFFDNDRMVQNLNVSSLTEAAILAEEYVSKGGGKPVLLEE